MYFFDDNATVSYDFHKPSKSRSRTLKKSTRKQYTIPKSKPNDPFIKFLHRYKSRYSESSPLEMIEEGAREWVKLPMRIKREFLDNRYLEPQDKCRKKKKKCPKNPDDCPKKDKKCKGGSPGGDGGETTAVNANSSEVVVVNFHERS